MKKLLFAGILMITSTCLQAQPEDWYFSITMGKCWPGGTFASANPGDSGSGYALNGFALNLDATYPLGNNFGLKGMVTLNSNPVNRNGLGTMMETRMKKLVPFTESERQYLTLTTNSWVSNSLVFGPVFSLDFDKVAWDLQVMTGMHVSYLPNQALLFSNPSSNWEYLQRSTNSIHVSMDWLAGTAVRFKVTGKLNLKVGVDYQVSTSKINYEELKTTKQNSIVTVDKIGSGTNNLRIQGVIGTAGFVYYL